MARGVVAPVSVLLEKTHESTAYILGRVARQGEYLFPPNQELSLLQLVAKAGGFLDDADTERLRLIRGRGASRKYWVLSVKEIEKAGRIGLDVALRDGDTLMVPTLPKVHILGCVRKPGALPSSLTLAQARESGAFTRAHERFWKRARRKLGDAAGTRSLIEVLLLHRRLPFVAVHAALDAVEAIGSCDPALVAIEARRIADGRGQTAVTVDAGERAGWSRPVPALAGYDALLAGSTR